MIPTADAIPSQADKELQEEFNQWAAAGRGDDMENHHSDITDQTLALMDLQPSDHVLDLGCGTGWASRRMARIVTAGEVVGLDVADEMLRRAEQTSSGVKNVRYVWGSAESIPAPDSHFSKVLSVESFYYYADQGKALDELLRVLAPEGKLFILINLYKDNHYSLRWADELKFQCRLSPSPNTLSCSAGTGFAAWRRTASPIAAPRLKSTPANGSRMPRSCVISSALVRCCSSGRNESQGSRRLGWSILMDDRGSRGPRLIV
jgi:SAM-dependent methyltransferase